MAGEVIAPWQPASLSAVRHIIASTLLGAGDGTPQVPRCLGHITLRPQQHVAATRLASLIAAHGGAMLAEPVGVGKTYTALATAAGYDGELLVVAPAALRTMWADSLHACGRSATILTHESLSRGTQSLVTPAFIIVDESHRLRSPATRRYALLANLCRQAKLLLVTATPVQNRGADLAAQLALFLGRSAWQMTDEELAAYVVRDSVSATAGRPRLNGPHLITLSTHDSCLDQLLALPPPVPANGEAVAAALLTYGLVHQWTSSRAALVAAIGRRRARGLALMSAIDAGRQPTRAELAAWTHADDTLQLAFPELMTQHEIDAGTDMESLHVALDRHAAALDALLGSIRTSTDPDCERVDALRRIRAAHPGERIIAFCHYAETVNSLRSKMSRDRGVAALTANGARVAGGRIRRGDVLAQFTVRPSGTEPTKPAERIDFLITTDLLSEGLNLQEASVIIHLDLPWNPARLDQRVGRALRMGSRHSTVTVYAIAPPADAERLLQLERRLRDKLNSAQRTIGVAGRILPSVLASPPPIPTRGLAEELSVTNAELRRWIDASCENGARRDVPIAAVRADVNGCLALIRDASGVHLVANTGRGFDANAASIRRAVTACGGSPTHVDAAQAAAAMHQLSIWLAARTGAQAIDFRAATSARSRRAALLRVAQTLARTPRHRRPVLAPLAAAVRAVATAPLAEGAERILETLVVAQLPDEAWLRSIATFGELNARPTATSSALSQPARAIALILLETTDSSL